VRTGTDALDYHKLQFARDLLRQAAQERETEWLAIRDGAQASAAAGRLDDAVSAYEQLLAKGGRKAEWWSELAQLYRRQNRVADAVDALLRSLTLDRTSAERHYDLGTLLEYNSAPGSAVEEYLHTVPSGHRHMAAHRVTEALAAYEEAYRTQPDDSQAIRNLASALRWIGQPARAARLLGHAACREGRYAKAIRELTRARELDVLDATAFADLATALNRTWRYAEAIEVCSDGIAAHPGAGRIYRELVWALTETNQPEAAAATAQAAATALSTPMFLASARHLSLPIVYDSADELVEWRRRFTDGLHRFAACITREASGDLALAREELKPNFYLAYQGRDDVDLYRRHGRLVADIMAASYPDWARPRPLTPPGDGRIRVGYVFSGHTGIDPVFLTWIAGHDRSQFEVSAYQLGGTVGPSTHDIRAASAPFHHLPEDLERICPQIVADDLHILVYLYVGMSPLWGRLAALRLAPVQCVTWGHPVTTGLPTIDYFLSNERMEPADGDAHYSERLVRLPGIGVSPSPPFLTPLLKTRADFGLPDDAVLYLSPQAPAKYLPQYDEVLASITSRVPNALIVLTEPLAPEVGRCLKQRLRSAFAAAGRDSDRAIRFLPNLPYDDFLQLIRRCDIFLDTIGWSGGLTTIDAVRCALPIVTCEGPLMRGRQSAGILAQLGVTETVGRDVEGFVEIAVGLGRDAGRRRALADRLRAAQDRLFDDRTCVPALEAFYRQAVAATD